VDMTAEIGIFGGTGLYDFASGLEEVTVETPYGPPSDVLAVGEVAGRRVAFLPRHGRSHAIPPHMINYRANIWAMKELGVTRIIGPTAAGSLQSHIRPGDFVVSDQFVDRTSGRKDTFYDGPITTHVSSAEPYCPELRPHAVEAGRHVGVTVHDHGTVVVIQGPRFSTIEQVVHEHGLGSHQYDPVSGVLPGQGARDLLCERRAHHRLRRGPSVGR